jgi:hypothetical protein
MHLLSYSNGAKIDELVCACATSGKHPAILSFLNEAVLHQSESGKTASAPEVSSDADTCIK